MSDPNTLRILELDGGGARGYLSLCFLQKFIAQWGINQADLWRNFDVITGTSIGGIQALAYAYGITPDALSSFFLTTAPMVFTIRSPSDVASDSCNASTASYRPSLAQKLILITADDPFYQSVSSTFTGTCTTNNYGSVLLKNALTTLFGTNTLQNLKTNVIIPSYQNDTSTYVLFSNISYSEFIGQNELISNVALATGAAPIYLPAAVFGSPSHTYIDGGIYQNNPAQLGRTLAKMIKPTANRTCILSLGTGIGEMGFDPGNPDPTIFDPRIDPKMLELQKSMPQLFDSIATIFGLFDIASTGAQESIAAALALESQYTLNQLYYYRFQPQLEPNTNTELDNTDPQFFTYLSNLTTTTFNNDIENIITFIGHLTA